MVSKQQICFSIALFALVSMTLLIIFGDKGVADLNMLRKSRDGLIERNEKLLGENLALYRSIKRLQSDPAYIESIARKELGVIGKGEIVFKLGGDAPHPEGRAPDRRFE